MSPLRSLPIRVGGRRSAVSSHHSVRFKSSAAGAAPSVQHHEEPYGSVAKPFCTGGQNRWDFKQLLDKVPAGISHLPKAAENICLVSHVTEKYLKEVQKARLARLREWVAKFDYAAVLLHDPCHVRYATDASNMTIWHKRNQIRYLMVPASESDPVTLWESMFVDRAGMEPLIGHTIDKWLPNIPVNMASVGDNVEAKVEEWAADVDAHLRPVCKAAGNWRVAIQGGDPLQAFALKKKGYKLGSGSQVVEHARARKVKNEIELIKAGVKTTCDAMEYLHGHLQEGISENALWSKLHEYNIAVGGEYVETRLLNSGARTSPRMQESSTKLLHGGDLVALDSDCTGPFGYFIDVSRTWHCPRPDGRYTEEEKTKFRKQQELMRYAREQNAHNMDLVKPGMTLREASEKAWKIPDRFLDRRYGIMAHGNGINGEYPYIYHTVDWPSSGYDGVIEEGMTISFEAFIAEDDEDGVKCEEHCVVGPNGLVNLSHHLGYCEYLMGKRTPWSPW